MSVLLEKSNETLLRKTKYSKIEKRILNERNKILSTINSIETRLKSNPTNEKKHSDHLAEFSDNQILAELANQSLPALDAELRRIDKALRNLKLGIFGICQDCEKDIPLERLEAMNFTACRCIKCQTEYEERKL